MQFNTVSVIVSKTLSRRYSLLKMSLARWQLEEEKKTLSLSVRLSDSSITAERIFMFSLFGSFTQISAHIPILVKVG